MKVGMKVGWILLDIVISIAAIVWIWDITHNFGAVAIALGLALWNFSDGYVRARW